MEKTNNKKGKYIIYIIYLMVMCLINFILEKEIAEI